VRELRFRLAEVDSDRPRAPVGLDSLSKVAPAAVAGIRADDACEEGRNVRVRQAEQPLDRGAEVHRADHRAVREAKAPAELENVGPPFVDRLWHSRREVPNQRGSRDPGDSSIGDEAVVCQ
jgi:hypothetical protein